LNTASRSNARVTIVLIVASCVAAHFLFYLLPKVFEPWNAQAIDQLFRLRSRFEHLQPAYDATIVHVDLNNSSIQQLHNFYLNRGDYAQVLRNLAAMHCAAQMYDFIFAARSNEKDDAALIEATAEAGNVYYGLAFTLGEGVRVRLGQFPGEEVAHYLEGTQWSVRVEGDPGSFFVGTDPLISFPALANAARGLGFISIQPDRDGVFRRVPLLVRTPGAFYPSLPFRVVCDYLGVTPDRIVVRPGTSITLKDARRPGGTAHNVVIPIDRSGNMVINFAGPWERMKHYSFADVFRLAQDRAELELWSEEFANRIVVISDVSTGSADIGPVPTDVNFPLSGLHANVVNTLLTEAFLRELSTSEMILVELLLMVLVLLLSLRFSSLSFLFANGSLVLSYLAVAAAGFFYGQLILQVVRPLFLLVFAAVAVTAYRYMNEAKQKEVLRKTFEAYFPPSVVRKIMLNPQLIAAAGQKKELTILFSDIKSFTTHTAAMTPDQIQKALNEYFEAMVEIVFSHQGTVDKYIGDGLMVFFGDPEPQEDHALRCVHTAIAMQEKARALKEKWEKDGGIPLQIRIGINTGVVVVGNMGSARRLSYTALGSPVNLAQRLETNAPVGGILISQHTYDLVKDQVPARSLGRIQVKGMDEAVSVYEVLLDGENRSTNTG
jgi:adenylate cyclase